MTDGIIVAIVVFLVVVLALVAPDQYAAHQFNGAIATPVVAAP